MNNLFNNNIYANIFYNTLDDLNQVKQNQEKWKKDILEEWEKTKKMPRKMKKRKRKELNSEWSIANYNLFDMTDVDLNLINNILKK